MYDKVVEEYKKEMEYMKFIIEQKRHIAMDIEEYFDFIYKYLKKQDNIDEKLLKKADEIIRFTKQIERKYESITKEKS